MEDRHPLDTYWKKRDFQRTPEPAAGGERGLLPRFVVQKHAARRLHYDVRLEVDGVLRSWAVPKGPSLDPSVRRLAVPTEDHPLSYAAFEGAIPPRAYGAGRVIVWDQGIYIPLEGGMRPADLSRPEKIHAAMRTSIAGGKVSVWFEGERLRGGWTFVRLEREAEPQQWLFFKRRDETADPDIDLTARHTTSILTGHSIETVAAPEAQE